MNFNNNKKKKIKDRRSNSDCERVRLILLVNHFL